jgi:GNAT superfamily N-acetyltransferase
MATLQRANRGPAVRADGRRHGAGVLQRWLDRHNLWPGQDGHEPVVRRNATLAVKGLRRRRAKDVPACARLLRVVFSEGRYPVEWPDAPRAWLAEDDVLDAWVVERQGEILGHVALCHVGRDGVSSLRWRETTGLDPSRLAAVSRLFVRPRVRRQGIGSALLDVAVAEARARGLVPVLDVTTLNEDAISLVGHRGWRLLAMDPVRGRNDRLRTHCYAAPREHDA